MRCTRSVCVSVFFLFVRSFANLSRYSLFFYYRCESALNRHIAVFSPRMLNLFAFYLKLHSERVVYNFFFIQTGVVLLLIFWVSRFSFHKFPMLITARFTPNQNKLCVLVGWRLAAAFDSLAQPVLHPLFHSLTVSVSRARSLSLSCSLFLSQIENVACAVCVDRAMLFLQVFSIALMYAYQNIQMFTLACIRNCDTNT